MENINSNEMMVNVAEPTTHDPEHGTPCSPITNPAKAYRQHQEEAIKAAAVHYQHEDRGQLISPCGTGKTAMAQGIRETLGATSTLVLVPSLILVKQFKQAWQEWRSRDYETMCVCSDKDILDDEDAVTVSLDEIGGVTTDPPQIARFLERRQPKVVFSTYHSLSRVCEAARRVSTVFDLAVCDEAHRTAGGRDKVFSAIHVQELIKAEKRLYMTATPRVVPQYNGRSVDDADYLYDMNDPDVFGQSFFRMTFKQAIDRRLLVDYQIIAIGVSDSELRTWLQGKNHPEFGDSLKDVAMNYALDLAMRKYNARRAITYHSRVDAASAFSERHSQLFPHVHTTHVNGGQSSGQRDERIQAFANRHPAVVSNARCLVEGFDLPSVDLVLFADPKRSTIDIVQAAGRALRLDPFHPDKVGLIVVPVFDADSKDLDRTATEGSFRNVVNAVRNMSNEDEDLKGYLTTEALEFGRPNGCGTKTITGKLKLVNFDPKIEGGLFARIIDKSVVFWDVQYQYLCEYRQRHPDHWPSSVIEFPEGNRLGRWCASQRCLHEKHKLPQSRITLLDRIGFPWVLADAWMTQYGHLQEYRKLHPDRWPPPKAEFPAENNLGSWCFTQRQTCKTGKISQSRIALLDQIDFPWVLADAWMTQYHHLQEYRKLHPDRWPPVNAEFPEGHRLWKWCQVQRDSRRKHRLSQDRIALLDQIEFQWGHDDAWATQYNCLLKYYSRHLDSWIPAKTEFPAGNRLGMWCNEQRIHFRRHQLQGDRIQMLNRIGFMWFPPDVWRQQYAYLEEYRKRYPDHWPYVTEEFPEGNHLGAWCTKQRYSYELQKLSKDRIKLLDEIGFRWSRQRNVKQAA